MNILIVEDNDDSRVLLRDYLQGCGFAVREAVNGLEALAIARQTPLDLVISDILMPEMDGFTLCRIIKEDENLRSIPVIFYSATYTDERDKELALDLGAARFLLKPFKLQKLLEEINQVLEENGSNAGSGIPRPAKDDQEIEEAYVDALCRKLDKKIRDLEEEKLRLRESENYWAKTFDAVTDIITIQDKNLRITRVNRAACLFFGAEADELIGRRCYEIFRGIAAPCQGCPSLATIKDIRTHSETIRHENLGKIFQVSTDPFIDSQGNLEFIVHFARDITEHKKMEEELFQAHKMEAIGTLAGGIAHDFNNILTAILGYTELSREAIKEGETPLDELAQVLKAGQRAKELIQQVLTFSRKDDHKNEPLAPYLIINESLKLLRATLPSTIEIRSEIDQNCGMIMANPTQLQQILVNLCTNALHAMESEKGVLRVTLVRKELVAEDVQSEISVLPGSFVELTVSDTGIGMDKITMDHIFEPYFTTKELGKGTGMGLAMVYGIVKDHGGLIRVNSEVDQGTSFQIYLPAIAAQIQEEAGQGSEETLPGGHERIMVVDDEEVIVKMLQFILERQGYAVTPQTDSEEALAVLRAAPGKFDLIITDQTMPEMSGLELSREVLQIRPNIPIILCTGYSSMISEATAAELGIKKFFMKPIERGNLLRLVRETLDE